MTELTLALNIIAAVANFMTGQKLAGWLFSAASFMWLLNLIHQIGAR